MMKVCKYFIQLYFNALFRSASFIVFAELLHTLARIHKERKTDRKKNTFNFPFRFHRVQAHAYTHTYIYYKNLAYLMNV